MHRLFKPSAFAALFAWSLILAALVLFAAAAPPGDAAAAGLALGLGAPLSGLAIGMVDVARWQRRYKENASRAGANWLEGVQNPRRSPTAAAKAAAGKWKNNMTKAINNGSYEKGLAKTSDAQIVQIATAVGAAGYESGVSARLDKANTAIAKLAPQVDNVSKQVQAMPQDTDAQREARMVANLKGMRAIKGA